MYLTRRQREMLDCIERFIQRNGYSPTLEEIGKMMGLSSLATVHKHLQNLEAKGLIRRNWNHSRAIELTARSQVRGGTLGSSLTIHLKPAARAATRCPVLAPNAGASA